MPRVRPEIIESIGESEAEWKANYEIIAANVNAFKWWHRDGKVNHKIIFTVGCAILALPESNGKQKSVFSGAGWIDAKLSNRQTAVTLEMKTLIYLNRFFLVNPRRFLYQEQKRLAAQATSRNMLPFV